jgi:hypothetical protein
MLPSMLINPACGALAGVPIHRVATTDVAVAQVQVRDFVEDVVQDVMDAKSDVEK